METPLLLDVTRKSSLRLVTDSVFFRSPKKPSVTVHMSRTKSREERREREREERKDVRRRSTEQKGRGASGSRRRTEFRCARAYAGRRGAPDQASCGACAARAPAQSLRDRLGASGHFPLRMARSGPRRLCCCAPCTHPMFLHLACA